jgi:uncharacterized membrane protein
MRYSLLERCRCPSLGHLLGLSLVFLWFFVGGIAHFAATDLEASIIPPYLPAHHTLVLISGAFELSGAAGLLQPSTRRAAGIGLVLLTLAVTPANVYMLQRSDLFHIPYWLLVARLPLQAGLVILIVWSAGVVRSDAGKATAVP